MAADACIARPVRVNTRDFGYGRTLASVTCAGVGANTEQVRRKRPVNTVLPW